MTEETRIAKLAEFLGISRDDVSATNYSPRRDSRGHGMEFDVSGGRTYAVMTGPEADKYADDRIRETVWAFRSEWLADYVPEGITAEHISAMRGDSCESFNDPMTALIEAGAGMDEFVSACISADGRVHFLDTYDGQEHEFGGFVIVQM